MPDARAPSYETPTARDSNPCTEREYQIHTPIQTRIASGNPAFNREASPSSRGRYALERISVVPEPERPSTDSARSGPTTSQSSTRLTATQFSMIVEITSCTPRFTFSHAEIHAQNAPIATEATR